MPPSRSRTCETHPPARFGDSMRSCLLFALGLTALACSSNSPAQPPDGAVMDGPSQDAPQAACDPAQQTCPMGQRCTLRRDVTPFVLFCDAMAGTKALY